jgi:integrase
MKLSNAKPPKKRGTKGEGTVWEEGPIWRGQITINGKKKSFSAPTKALAKTKRKALINQRDNGELSAGQSPTMAAWLEHWMSITEETHALSTHAGYAGYIRSLINPAIGKIRLDKLTLDTLEKFYAELAKRGLSGSTRHQVHSIIRVALKHAVWRGHVGRNVAALVKPPSPSKTEKKIFGSTDLSHLDAALVGHRYEARWQIGLALAVRPGEATALEWKNVDLEKKEIYIRQQLQSISGRGTVLVEYVKTGASERTVPLPDFIVEMLRETRTRQLVEMAAAGAKWNPWEPDGKPHAFCFTQPDGQPLRSQHDMNQWRNVLTSAGLPYTRRYTARHTGASWLIARGVDPVTVAKILGHSSAAFTMATYVHALDERVVEAALILDKARPKKDKHDISTEN